MPLQEMKSLSEPSSLSENSSERIVNFRDKNNVKSTFTIVHIWTVCWAMVLYLVDLGSSG